MSLFQYTVSGAYLAGLSLSEYEFTKLNRILDVYHNENDPIRALALFNEAVLEFGNRDRQSFEYLSQLKGFLFKAPHKKTATLSREAAIQSFLECDDACLMTNERAPTDFLHDERFRKARHLIHQVIGDFDDSTFDEIASLARPGSGQALGFWNPLRHAAIYKYVAYDLTSTSKAARYHGIFNSPHVKDRNVRPVIGACLSFVPKDVKIFRSIAIEPNLNMYLQLGVHEWLSRALRNRAGQDIRDQTANQILARWGSIGGGISTIDFSSASDLISDSLVFYLLPRTWYNFLSSLRSDKLLFEGEVIHLSKFSTMGNGFTFALETLIFWALARSVADPTHTVSVYGDDVCLSTSIAEDYLKLAEYAGLVPNWNKSYMHGPFRESCGTDWYEGVNITPIKITKSKISPRDIYRIYNRWGKRPSGHLVRTALRDFCKKKFKVWHVGLPNEDDGSCVFSTFDYIKPKLVYSKKFQAYRFRGLVEKPVQSSDPEDWLYLQALRSGAKDAESALYLKDRTVVREALLSPGVNLVCDRYGTGEPNLVDLDS